MSLEYSIGDNDDVEGILVDREFDLKKFKIIMLPSDTCDCKEYKKYPFYIFKPYVTPDIHGLENINQNEYPNELYVFALIPKSWEVMTTDSGKRVVYFDENHIPRFIVRDNRKVQISHLIEKTSYICDKINDNKMSESVDFVKKYICYNCSCCKTPT
jgi:hypothetical protein